VENLAYFEVVTVAFGAVLNVNFARNTSGCGALLTLQNLFPGCGKLPLSRGMNSARGKFKPDQEMAAI
jgi:hypothetical protein